MLRLHRQQCWLLCIYKSHHAKAASNTLVKHISFTLLLSRYICLLQHACPLLLPHFLQPAARDAAAAGAGHRS
jgi:hypothetical protein